MEKFPIESLDRALDHPKIEVEKSALGNELFERVRKFKINNTKYKIKWFSNISYLEHGDMIVPFFSVRQADTWPIPTKMNLQFYDRDMATCCIVVIENYEKLSTKTGGY